MSQPASPSATPTHRSSELAAHLRRALTARLFWTSVLPGSLGLALMFLGVVATEHADALTLYMVGAVAIAVSIVGATYTSHRHDCRSFEWVLEAEMVELQQQVTGLQAQLFKMDMARRQEAAAAQLATTFERMSYRDGRELRIVSSQED